MESRNINEREGQASLLDGLDVAPDGGAVEENAALESDAKSAGASENQLREFEPEDIADDILLSTVDGVGALTTERLVEFFGSATNVLNASVDELSRVQKVGPTLARKIAQARSGFDVDALIQFCRDNEIAVLSLRDSRYPERLRHIDNPPRILYVRGKLAEEDRYAIAIVGTRHATPYGRTQATRLARELVDAGFTVVSGLALGIDGCAHRAAIDARGRTIAVLGGGVANIFPSEHVDLAGRIVAGSGALISEYHPLTSPLRGNFPARNRIISGLSLGTIVVESGVKSGSLITARFAAEQNRELFVVPGPIDSEYSRGCHQLLREGAVLTESVADIIEALPSFERPEPRKRANARAARPDDSIVPGTLGISASSLASIDTRKKQREERAAGVRAEKDRESVKSAAKSSESAPKKKTSSRVERAETKANVYPPLPEGLSENELKIIDALGDGALTIDELVLKTGISVAGMLGLVSLLEFKQVILRREGNSVERVRA